MKANIEELATLEGTFSLGNGEIGFFEELFSVFSSLLPEYTIPLTA